MIYQGMLQFAYNWNVHMPTTNKTIKPIYKSIFKSLQNKTKLTNKQTKKQLTNEKRKTY